MLKNSLFNEHDEDSNLLGVVTGSVMGKQNRLANKAY